MNEITVHVVRRKGKNLYLRFTDPVTGKRHEKSRAEHRARALQVVPKQSYAVSLKSPWHYMRISSG